ncbi:hypothetical protein M0813_04306 [Anaeramoeba flamelloides]|uniref:Cystatin domain-containing protein n=1 Tax=Anaeramoeba flamelloides TaxID=1746091 RepID=A0ABQ8XK92_9EUKA|nr:hypothetical protein M0813_04306 [Anaeramoeba flamelloides]
MNFAGGYSKIEDHSHEKIQEIVQFGHNEIRKRTNSNYHLRRIISVEKQIVNGVNYRIKAEFVENAQVTIHEIVVHQSFKGDLKLSEHKIVN